VDEPEERGSPALRALRRRSRLLAGTVAAGALVGLVVAGVGGRLAMRLMASTSDPSVQGVVTDDGFVVGAVTLTGTLQFVLLEGLPAGILAGLIYLALRPFLLGRYGVRYATCGLWGAAVFGPTLVHADGVDFNLLGPAWLAIALFVALPGLLGLLVPPAVERATRPGGWFMTAPRRRALSPLLLLAYPPLLIGLAVPTAAVIVGDDRARRSPRLASILENPTAKMAVRSLLVGIAAVGALALARDATSLL
jgi:hypothetical protein